MIALSRFFGLFLDVTPLFASMASQDLVTLRYFDLGNLGSRGGVIRYIRTLRKSLILQLKRFYFMFRHRLNQQPL